MQLTCSALPAVLLALSTLITGSPVSVHDAVAPVPKQASGNVIPLPLAASPRSLVERQDIPELSFEEQVSQIVKGEAQLRASPNTDPGVALVTTSSSLGLSSAVSPAVRAGGFVYISGQLPTSPTTGQIIANDVVAQTYAVLFNLQTVVEASGSNLGKVIMCHVYLKNISDFQTVNDIYAQFFGTHRPARVQLSVANLPLGALVEIEAIAAA